MTLWVGTRVCAWGAGGGFCTSRREIWGWGEAREMNSGQPPGHLRVGRASSCLSLPTCARRKPSVTVE